MGFMSKQLMKKYKNLLNMHNLKPIFFIEQSLTVDKNDVNLYHRRANVI